METLETIRQAFREGSVHRCLNGMSKLSEIKKVEIGEEQGQKARSMLIIFFDIKGIVHKEFILVGQTVNSTYYCDTVQ
jgi:hypothetical protein